MQIFRHKLTRIDEFSIKSNNGGNSSFTAVWFEADEFMSLEESLVLYRVLEVPQAPD